MLACENQECSRRFCEHCLLTHLGEDVDPMSSDAWTMVNGKVLFFETRVRFWIVDGRVMVT